MFLSYSLVVIATYTHIYIKESKSSMIPVGDSLCDSQINTQCTACPDNKQEKTFKWSEKEQQEEMGGVGGRGRGNWGGWREEVGEEKWWEGVYIELLFKQTQNQVLLSESGEYI